MSADYGRVVKRIGLELKPSKTHISHTQNMYGGNVGFDFLGFTVRQFPVGKYHSGKSSNGKLLGYKTLITPSKTKLKTHTQKIGKLIDGHKSVPQSDLCPSEPRHPWMDKLLLRCRQ